MSRKSTLIFMLGIAIIFGAFGAHGLKEWVPAEKIESFKTGVLYQITMMIGLIAVRFSTSFDGAFKWAFHSVFIGTCLFSGSIYLLVVNTIFNWPIQSILGPITPIGGLLMIIGWFRLGFLFFKKGE